MKKKGKYADFSYSKQIFLKSMLITASAITLILIGYFTAAFFSGGL